MEISVNQTSSIFSQPECNSWDFREDEEMIRNKQDRVDQKLKYVIDLSLINQKLNQFSVEQFCSDIETAKKRLNTIMMFSLNHYALS